MNTPHLPEDVLEATTKLCAVLAQSPVIIASKARIGLFFQDQKATELFRKVTAYGEELRSKHLAGMPPTEEEIAQFDQLRQNVVDNPLARDFLEARQTIDDMLVTINQFMSMAIDKGKAPTLEEVAAAAAAAASSNCSCGGHCHGDGECHCDGECCGEGNCDGECKHDH